MNRADCFITIHRKVQAPDTQTKKTTELHIRKVRETETGGEPTPIDEPITLVMNTQGTGFRMSTTQKSLFSDISNDFDKYSSFHIQPNLDFLNTND